MTGGAFAFAFDASFDPPAAPGPTPPRPAPLPAYVDVEALLVYWLRPSTSARLCTDLPADLAAAVPVVQVTRVGGIDLVPSLDKPIVDVDCYALGRGDAYALAQQVRDLLRFTLPQQLVDVPGEGTVYVARVDTLSGPSWRPYDNTNLRRFGASYQLTTQKGLS